MPDNTHQIYLSFSILCEIQEEIFLSAPKEFGYVEGHPFRQQDPVTMHRSRGIFASTRFLVEWSQTAAGRNQIRQMEMTMEGRDHSLNAFSTAATLLDFLSFAIWRQNMENNGNEWLRQLNMAITPPRG
jgi:hypothetical protein